MYLLKWKGGKNGWVVKVWAVEVGCRGFPAASKASFLKGHQMRGERTRTLKRIAGEAEKYSRAI